MRLLPVSLTLLLLLSLVLAAPVDAKPHGIVGVSQSGCIGCHGGAPDPTVTPLLEGLPERYAPGATYTFTIRVLGGPPLDNEALSNGGHAGGFNLRASHGELKAPFGSDDIMISVEGGSYHDPTQGHINVPFPPHTWGEATFQHPTQSSPMAGANKREWEIKWKAPDVGTGDVTFSLATLAANGDHRNSTADRWNTATFTVIEGDKLPFMQQYGPILIVSSLAVAGTGGAVAWKKGFIGGKRPSSKNAKRPAAKSEAPKSAGRSFIQCPDCNTSVREERLVEHLRRVHDR